MTIRNLLIFAPLLVVVFLLQSYLWVPSYEEQTRGNPKRLTEYITASIGDAAVLNPILSADSASSTIESMVFEGLIDRDEDLRFRGRLATSWDIYEEAFFYLNEKADIPGLGKASAQEIVEYLHKAKAGQLPIDSEVKSFLNNVKEISVVPPKEFQVTWRKQGTKDKPLKFLVRPPARIKLVLGRVDQDLFENLAPLLGDDYFRSFPSEDYLSADDEGAETLSSYGKEILPATEHNPIIIFHLRPNVKFHDGHVFDADDVKFTYEALMNPKNLSPRISDYEPVKRVEVIGPLTVRIVYKRLYSPAVGTWGMGILPEHQLNNEALRKEAIRRGRDPEHFSMRQSSFNRRPIGCGPFVFRQWKSDQYIILDRFDDYWEGPPNYERYIYRVVPDLLTQEMEFYAGTVDTYNVQPHQVQRLENDPRYQSFSGLSFGYTYIGYNMRREPFNDRRVRRALTMAVDVDKIIDFVLYGQGERITGPFVKQTDYYNHDIKPIPYDPEGALRLLEEAGWNRNKDGWLEKNGKRLQFTLITNSGNDLRKAVMAIVQDAWRQIGIDVRTDLLEWSVFIQERVDKADFDALILGWSMGIEPDLYQIWHSSQTNPHQLNFVGFKNAEADDLIIKIRQEYDHDRQVVYSHKLHEIIASEQPYTFLYVGKWTAVLDKRIVIKEVDAQGEVTYKKITPTKTGSFTFYFNKWIKLPEAPTFALEG
ncbi:MAG: peptide-binding protein [Desulfobacteraceae bacterium]|jgi:ABC-type transport system substrate-binding protein